MKYEAPQMEVVALGADTAIATQIDLGINQMMSKIPTA